MSILDNARTAVNMVSNIQNIELHKKLRELQSEIEDLWNENQELKKKITDLNKGFDPFQGLILKDDAFWKEDGAGPFCPSCLQNDKPKQVRMMGGPDQYHCVVCPYIYVTPQEQARQDAFFRHLND
jgi:hypothetical protein